MSSRIIRGDDQQKKMKVMTASDPGFNAAINQGHIMNVEKQAFEQGYQEGERIGKQMGERMMETAVKRYDRSIVELVTSHKMLLESMEKQTVRMALEISKKIVQRELTLDPDLVSALASVALKRVQGHQSVTLRVSRHDAERVRAEIGAINPAVEVKEDSALERGDFMVDTGQTHLDGRLSGQIDSIGRVLLED